MRRTVILVTLISLLIAVAGVTAAQDNAFDPGAPETIAPEPTNPEPTVEQPAEPEIEDELPDARGGEGTEETTVEDPANSGEYDGGEEDEDGGSSGPGSDGRENGRGEERDSGGSGEHVEGNEGDEERAESGGDKVTVCHKGKTLSVGAPARPAHLGHGDSLGPC